MMKRVKLCGLKHFDVRFCLRFGDVVARRNGDLKRCPDCEDQSETSNIQPCTCNKTPKDKNSGNSKNKSGLLNAIRRKWWKSKRAKGTRAEARRRSDSLLKTSNNCYDENRHCSEENLSIPRESEFQSSTSNDLTNPYISRAADDSDDYDNPNHYEEVLPDRNDAKFPTSDATEMKSSSLKPYSSHSMPHIPCTPGSSPTCKTDFSELELCNPSCSRDCTNEVPSSSITAEALDSSLSQELPHNLHLSHKFGNLTQELYKLSKHGWYWGPINRSEAESKLADQPDGAFLVRDSLDDRYILSLSFRSYGKTLHTRIEHSSGLFSFYSQPEPEGHASIVELIQQSMCHSQSGVFCYSRSGSPGSVSFPVRLIKPISRFTQVRSLKYLCRFLIRQYTRYDHIQKLPLPQRIKGYLEEGHY